MEAVVAAPDWVEEGGIAVDLRRSNPRHPAQTAPRGTTSLLTGHTGNPDQPCPWRRSHRRRSYRPRATDGLYRPSLLPRSRETDPKLEMRLGYRASPRPNDSSLRLATRVQAAVPKERKPNEGATSAE